MHYLFNKIKIFISLLFLVTLPATLIRAQLSLPNSLVAYDSPKGIAYFQESKIRNDFWRLSQFFITQKNLKYCGVASSVMVLNALGLSPQIGSRYSPYTIFTQDNIFNNEVLKITTPDKINTNGMSLSEFNRILKAYNLKTSLYYADKIFSKKEFKKITIEALKTPNQYVIVNFCRKNLGEVGCGHFSPLAAYDEKSDRFLLLDVSRYKYPSIWVKSSDLWSAVNTKDEDLTYRGLVIVEKK